MATITPAGLDGQELPPPPTGVAAPSDAIASSRRRSNRWMIMALVVCPCHLPLVATLVAALGLGSAGAFLTDYRVPLTVAFIPIFAACAVMAYRTSRQPESCRGSCDCG